MFVNLVLLKREIRNCSSELTMENLLELLTNGIKSRILCEGEAGVGKTTLLAKIAHGWASGTCLQEIDLLFWVPLRELEQSEYFDTIPQRYLMDLFDIQPGRLDEFIRSNQRRAIILLDGLDEYKGDVNDAQSRTAVTLVMRGEKFTRTPVLVTTRPWRSDQIIADDVISKFYTHVRIEGFREADVANYIKQFFEGDTQSSETLIQITRENDMIASNMAPYPIFCSMLCHMWDDLKKREIVVHLETYSELLCEIIYSLIEHYADKRCARSTVTLEDCQKQCNDCFKKVGEVAFVGLLKKRMVLREELFEKHTLALNIAYNVGIVTKEKRVAPVHIRQQEGKTHLVEVRFPHKLLQEYLAGEYLSSLYEESPTEFTRILVDKILPNHGEYRYLLYFTAAHGGGAGRAVMKALCETYTEQDHELFIVDVAFECNDKYALAPVIDLMKQSTTIDIWTGPGGVVSKHIWSGYLATWAAYGQQVVG